MTLSIQTARNEALGNGATTVFAYTFPISAASELQVYVDGALQPSTAYTVSGVGVATGGTVTFTTAPPAPATAGVPNVILYRDTPVTQLLDLLDTGAFKAESTEAQLDKLTRLLVEVKESLARAVAYSRAAPNTSVVLPTALVANKFLQTKADGSGWQFADAFATLANPMTLAEDLIKGGVVGAPVRLAKGTDGALLQTLGGVVTWNGSLAMLGKSLVEQLEVLQTGVNTVTVKYNRLSIEGVVVTEPVAVTVTMPAGLDAGVEAASTHYALWAFTNDDGSAKAYRFSTSYTAPTVPATFTKKRLIGTVRNNAASNFIAFEQRGAEYFYQLDTTGTETQVLAAGQATVFTVVSLATIVPPPVRTVDLQPRLNVVHTAANATFNIFMRTTGSGLLVGILTNSVVTVAAAVAIEHVRSIRMPCDASQQVDYRLSAVPGTSGGASLNVLGFLFPI